MRAAAIGWIVGVAACATAPAQAQAEAPHVLAWEQGPGTTVALVEDHRAPLVSMQLLFPAGSWSPWVRESGAETAFRGLLLDAGGTLRDRADRFAVRVTPRVGSRSSTLQVSCLKQDLDAARELLLDALRNDRFDRQELKRRARAERIGRGLAEKSPSFRGGQALARQLFAEDDPRRLAWEAPPKPRLDSARLAAARDALIRLPGRVIGLAGDLTREEAVALADGLLPTVFERPPGNLDPRLRALRSVAGRAPITVPMRKLTQVYFGYGRGSLTYDDPDYPAFVVADHVLGGHFYSRLVTALRHEGGETYGAHSSSDGDTVPGAYRLASFTRAGNAEVAEAKLREALVLFHADGISEEEREAAVGYLTGRRAFDRQSPAQVLSRWLRERTLGLPQGHLDGVADRTARLPLEQINDFIDRFYDPSGFLFVRIVPE